MSSFKIYSHEHHAWWKTGGWGYTADESKAGWFHAEVALEILFRSSLGSPPGRPNEVLVDPDTGLVFALERFTSIRASYGKENR